MVNPGVMGSSIAGLGASLGKLKQLVSSETMKILLDELPHSSAKPSARIDAESMHELAR